MLNLQKVLGHQLPYISRSKVLLLLVSLLTGGADGTDAVTAISFLSESGFRCFHDTVCPCVHLSL